MFTTGIAWVLIVIGGGWALLGFANCFVYFSDLANMEQSQGTHTVMLMFNVLLFIVPGLIVGSLGALLKKRV